MQLTRIKTPCIGVCSTTFGDTVCRGCKRFVHEIVNWNGYNPAQRDLIWNRLDALLLQVVQHYLVVTQPDVLRDQLDYQNLRYHPHMSPESWVMELLKAAGDQPLHWASYGLELKPGVSMRPGQLYQEISQAFHALSQAHYDRCYLRPARTIEQLVEDAARQMQDTP